MKISWIAWGIQEVGLVNVDIARISVV